MPDAYNPYLPDKGQQLSALLMSLGQGITASDMTGRGVLPGLGLGAGIYGASQAQAQQEAEKAWQWQQQYDMQQEYRKAQEDSLRTQNDIRKQEAQSKMQLGDAVRAGLGFAPPQNGPTMGPGSDYFARVGAAESNNRYDVPNAQGSGAYGKYQFMPDTWANVAQANPNLGLPFNMRQSTPDQQEAAMRAFTDGNAKALASQGIQPTPDNLYLAHRFGVDGAKTVLSANPSTPIASLFPAQWSQQNPDMRGATVGQFVQGAQQRFSGAGAPGGGQQSNAQPQIDPQTLEMIRAISVKDPEAAAKLLIQARQGLKKEDAWQPVNEQNAKMMLGPAYDQTKAYQRNSLTGEIKPIGGSLVNINNQQESEFTKQVAKQDAETLGGIQSGTRQVVETANKVQLAADLLKNTYTGPGGNFANEFFKTLGAMGVESAANKANAATAATALISELTPKMRVAGSGATSDFEMRTFAAALPSLLNMPGGNEMVAQYWQRIADRALAVQGLAEKHAAQSKGLTGTGFAKEVKDLGPLFTKEEIAQMQGVAKAKPSGERKPLDQFGGEPDRNMSPMPAQRKPLNAFGGQ